MQRVQQMERGYANPLMRRQSFGTDWVTETVRITLPPCVVFVWPLTFELMILISGQSSFAPDPTAPPTGGGTLTRTIYVSQVTATETAYDPSPLPTTVTETAQLTTATDTVSLATLTLTETTYPPTSTYYPPTTTCSENCSTKTVTSKIKAATTAAVPQRRPTRPCAPGDAGEKAGGVLSPTVTQRATLIAIGIYIVAILIGSVAHSALLI